MGSALDHLEWQNSHLLTDDLTSVNTDVKDSADGEFVVFGSGSLVRGPAECDLIDECRLLLFPIILGEGKRMFDDRGTFARFNLGHSIVVSSGVVILTYTRHTPV